MKIVEKRTKLFRCETCRTSYPAKKTAEMCERRDTEKRRFKKGDRVEILEPRECVNGGQYRTTAIVVRIIGPMPPDEEYERKWLGGQHHRLNSHVLQYEVEYDCPICRKTERNRFYAPELRRAD